MKILIAGNLANMGYELTRALRTKKCDVSLLMPKFPSPSEDPVNIDPEINKKIPNWIIKYDNSAKKMNLNNWKLQIIKEMRKKKYDIIIALTEFPIFAIFSGKPYLVLSTGSDLRELAFKKTIKGFLYRWSCKKAKIILWSEPDKRELLRELKIYKKSKFLGIPRVTNFFPEKINEKELEEKFVIFHPTRQDWIQKKNDLFLKSFKKMIQQGEKLYLILTNQGPDMDKARSILEECDPNSYRIIPRANYKELQYYYNLSNLVVDQFTVGSFGMISVEAMMCAKPIILRLNKEYFEMEKIKIPEGLLNVNSEEEIFQLLKNLIKDKKFCELIGKKNLEFMNEFRNKDKMIAEYLSICDNVLRKNNNFQSHH